MTDSDTRALAGTVDIRSETGSTIVKYVLQNPTGRPIRITLEQSLPAAVDESTVTFTSEYYGDSWSIEDGCLGFQLELAAGQTVRTAYATESVDPERLQAQISKSKITVREKDGEKVETLTGFQPTLITGGDEKRPETQTTGTGLHTLEADDTADDPEMTIESEDTRSPEAEQTSTRTDETNATPEKPSEHTVPDRSKQKTDTADDQSETADDQSGSTDDQPTDPADEQASETGGSESETSFEWVTVDDTDDTEDVEPGEDEQEPGGESDTDSTDDGEREQNEDRAPEESEDGADTEDEDGADEEEKQSEQNTGKSTTDGAQDNESDEASDGSKSSGILDRLRSRF
jgi:hypothetical protein